jgi:hypothetical protein
MSIMVMLVAAPCSYANGKQEAPPGTASVSYIEGDVTLNGSAAALGDEVKAGATIQTGNDAQCEIVFRTKNIIHIASDTTLVFHPQDVTRGATLGKGAVAMVLKNLAANGEERFGITTKSVVGGVRGTSYFVRVGDDGSTYICACNGAIHITGADGKFDRDLESPHHKAFLVSGSGGDLTVSDAPLLYHTDADVDNLARKIGVTLDWTKVDK